MSKKTIPLKKISPNPDNPRFITDSKFKKLCKSIKEFPKMMSLRPMVVDENWMTLGGNKRYDACIALGYENIPEDWVKQATDLTPEEKKRFIIEDNVSFGEWDMDKLAKEWNPASLTDWGMDLPYWSEPEEQEIDVEDGAPDGEELSEGESTSTSSQSQSIETRTKTEQNYLKFSVIFKDEAEKIHFFLGIDTVLGSGKQPEDAVKEYFINAGRDSEYLSQEDQGDKPA